MQGYLADRRARLALRSGDIDEFRKHRNEAFWELLCATTFRHLYPGLHDRYPRRPVNACFYEGNIERELERFRWDDHLDDMLARVEAGERLMLWSSDVLRRDVEGFFLEGLLGLEQRGDDMMASEGVKLSVNNEALLEAGRGKMWYSGLHVIVRDHGKGRVIYANLEETHHERTAPPGRWPQMTPLKKRRFLDWVEKAGLMQGKPLPADFVRCDGPYRWWGALKNPPNHLETTRFFKLVGVDHWPHA